MKISTRELTGAQLAAALAKAGPFDLRDRHHWHAASQQLLDWFEADWPARVAADPEWLQRAWVAAMLGDTIDL
jgi:hypothetical protein